MRRMQGRSDSSLTALGRRQADACGRLVASLGDVRAIYASPLGRAKETAQIIRRYLDVDVVLDERLAECDLGDWTGELIDEVRYKWPQEWAAFEADRFNYRGPRRENYPDLIVRASSFLDEMLSKPGGDALIVSHGVIGRVMLGTLMGLADERMLEISLPNDVVYRVCVPSANEPGSRSLHRYDASVGDE